MSNYESPVAEIVIFSSDVIKTSGEEDNVGGIPDDWKPTWE